MTASNWSEFILNTTKKNKKHNFKNLKGRRGFSEGFIDFLKRAFSGVTAIPLL